MDPIDALKNAKLTLINDLAAIQKTFVDGRITFCEMTDTQMDMMNKFKSTVADIVWHQIEI